MISWKRNLWLLWFGVLLSTSSYTLVVPFLPLYLMSLGVTENVSMWSGVVYSITFLVGAVMAPIWGAKADRNGKKRMVIRAGFSLAVVYFLGSLVQNPWELMAQRILHGLVAGFVPASMAIVASNTPEKHVSYSLGVMQTAGAVGGILGPLAGGVLSEAFGMRLSFVAASAFILAGTLLVLFFVKEETAAPAKEKASVLDDLKSAVGNRMLLNVLFVSLIVQVAVMILQPLLTLYVAKMQGQLEGSVLSSGFVFSISGIATILATPFWARIGEKRGFTKTLVVALIGAGMLSAAQLFAGNLWSFSVVRFVLGLFISGVLPAINSILVQRTAPDFRGRAFGLNTSAQQIGSMVGPLIGGVLGGWLGIEIVFVLTGVILASTAVMVKNAERKGRRADIGKTAASV